METDELKNGLAELRRWEVGAKMVLKGGVVWF